jgi:integrase
MKNISMRKDGLYSVRLTIDGKRVQKYAKSITEAELILRQLTNTSPPAPEASTLVDLARNWLLSANLKPKTEESYRQTLDRHILSILGTLKPVKDVKPLDVVSVIAAARQKKLSDRSVQYVYVVLRRLLQVAVEWQIVDTNAAARVDKPKNNAVIKDVWTKAEIQAFLVYTSANKGGWNSLFLVALLSGCRLGELLALKTSDITNDGVYIRRSLAELSGGKFVIQTPKNASSVRFVVLPELALKKLTELPTSASGFIFRYENDNPPTRSSLRRCFITACKGAGVKYISIHGLRHVHTSILAAAGVSVKAAQLRLGHSNPSVTLKVYTHLLAENDKQTEAALTKFLGI